MTEGYNWSADWYKANESDEMREIKTECKKRGWTGADDPNKIELKTLWRRSGRAGPACVCGGGIFRSEGRSGKLPGEE